MQFIKTAIVHVLLIAVMLYGLFWVASLVLNNYTRHGEYITLPNLKGLSFEETEKLLTAKKLRLQISDTVYMDKYPKYAVVEQNPSPNSKVKEGRIIYLSLNSGTAQTIPMPNLINTSEHYAESVLQSLGFKLGEITYKPDIAAGAVLDMQYRGYSIQPDAKVAKGSTIDLIVGDGTGSTIVSMPNLSGLSLQEARVVLNASQLNLGSIIYENDVMDSLHAIVKRQNPAFSEGASIRSGETIDLYVAIQK